MTLLVGGTAVLLSCLLALGTVTIGRAVTDRVRAQSAADAAALAAAADSAPGGTGDPAGVASRLARLNGATLARCLCTAGATAAQVEVLVGDARARARAAFDPTRVLPAADAIAGLDPRLGEAVRHLLTAGRGRITVVSGIRTAEQQSLLWARALDRYGDAETADDWVARPGSSAHELGLAVDLGGDLDLASRLVVVLDLPLVSPLPHEPWHFELRT